jgi:hypothetical protein
MFERDSRRLDVDTAHRVVTGRVFGLTSACVAAWFFGGLRHEALTLSGRFSVANGFKLITKICENPRQVGTRRISNTKDKIGSPNLGRFLVYRFAARCEWTEFSC